VQGRPSYALNDGQWKQCTADYKFTGKERDAESGLDDFGARFHASALGRFMMPDWDAKPVTVPYAKFGDPQTLNLYSYVENAPVNRADADGHAENKLGACPGSPGCPITKISDDQPGPVAKADSAQNQSSQFTVTVNNRPADIPGGKTLDKMGIDHQWITTSDGASAGLGTAKGVPKGSPDLPLTPTEVVDHHGETAVSTTTYTNVDRAAINSFLKIGTPQGPWVPGVNDCNTFVQNAISSSTPHDINSPSVVTKAGVTQGQLLYHNVVVYADGTVHPPGGP
jgi:RHS repeat-associated protein